MLPKFTRPFSSREAGSGNEINIIIVHTMATVSEDLLLYDLHHHSIISCLREKGPMGGAPYIGSRLGGGPIFEVSLSQLDAKERPGKLPTRSSLSE